MSLQPKLKSSQRKLMTVLTLGLIASFGLAAFYPYRLSAVRFYSTETRVWELFAGVILAYTKDFLPRFSFSSANFTSLGGLLMIVASFFAVGREAQVPGLASLMPVVGTLLVIASTQEGSISHSILSNRLMVAIGLVSYNLYLWHQPLLALSRIANGGELDAQTTFAVLCLLPPVSATTYLLVERPFRNNAMISKKAALSGFGAAALCLITFCIVDRATEGFSDYYLSTLNAADAREVKALGEAMKSRGLATIRDNGNCKFWSERIDEKFEARFRGCAENYGKAYVILGDSHALDLFNAIAASSNLSFIVGVSRGACSPHRLKDKSCPYERFLNFSQENSRSIVSVFFTQSGAYFGIPQGAGSRVQLQLGENIAAYAHKFPAAINFIWFGPQYEPRINLDAINPMRISTQTLNFSDTKPFVLLDDMLRKIAGRTNVRYFSKLRAMHVRPEVDFVLDDRYTYSDEDHMSGFGEEVFGKRIVEALQSQDIIE